MTNKYIYFTIKQLFIQGVHLGAQLSKNNSNMRRYLLPIKTNTYFAILNLKYSTLYFRLSFNVLQNIISKRGTVLVVNESEALISFLKDSWRNLTQPISLGNWSSGTLSNFRYILKKSLKTYFVKSRLADKIKRLSLGNARLPMKLHNKIRAKFNLAVFLTEMRRRIRKLYSLPHAVFITDTMLSSIAVEEANRVEIPLIGIVDSTNDPLKITYPIPGNSSSVSTLLFYYKLVKLLILKGILLEKRNFLRKLKFKLLLNLETNLIIKKQSRSNFPVFSKMSAQYVESFFVKNSLYSFFKNLQGYYLFFPHYAYNSKMYKEYTLLLNLFKWVAFKNTFAHKGSQQLFSFGQEELLTFLAAISSEKTNNTNKTFSSFFVTNADYFSKKVSATFLSTVISQLTTTFLKNKVGNPILNLNSLFYFFKSTNNIVNSTNSDLLNKVSIFGIALDKKEISLAKVQALNFLFNSNLNNTSVFFKFNRRILNFVDLVTVAGKKLNISLFIPKAEGNFSFLNSSTVLHGLLENKDSLLALEQYYKISNYYFKPEGRVFSSIFPFVELSLLYRNKFSSSWFVNSLFRNALKPLTIKLSFADIQFSDIQVITKWLNNKVILEDTSSSVLSSHSVIFIKRLVASFCFFLPIKVLTSQISASMSQEIIKSLSFFNNFRLYTIPQPVKRVRYFTKYFNDVNNKAVLPVKFTLDFYKPILQAKVVNSSNVKSSFNIDSILELKNKFSTLNLKSCSKKILEEKNSLNFDSSFFKNYKKNNFYFWYGKIV